MLQQLLALTIIASFLIRLFFQKRKKQIGGGEFIFWLFFWLLAAVAVVFIKDIDKLVADLGFSGSGIEVLLYLGIAISFYLIFRLRLHVAKLERNITELVRAVAKDK